MVTSFVQELPDCDGVSIETNLDQGNIEHYRKFAGDALGRILCQRQCLSHAPYGIPL
jgi:hypothetical protein